MERELVVIVRSHTEVLWVREEAVGSQRLDGVREKKEKGGRGDGKREVVVRFPGESVYAWACLPECIPTIWGPGTTY
jgi:hypothetical protein